MVAKLGPVATANLPGTTVESAAMQARPSDLDGAAPSPDASLSSLADIGKSGAAQSDGEHTIAEEEVRLRAYYKWEAAGRPEGDGATFWIDAEHEFQQQARPHFATPSAEGANRAEAAAQPQSTQKRSRASRK